MKSVAFGLQLLFIFLDSAGSVSKRDLGFTQDVAINKGWKEDTNERQMNTSVNYKRDFAFHTVESEANGQTCKDINLWFVWDNETKSCHCGDDLNGIVQCDTLTKELSVIDCYCLTVHSTKDEQKLPVVGKCIFNCANQTRYMYHGAPSDCASLNRQGTLCGQCLDGYTVPAYSYEFKCIRCDSQLENWGLYIVFAFLPLTVFIVIILVFRINVLSPKLNMFVFSAQGIAIPIFIRLVLAFVSKGFYKITAGIIITVYGIWNLDFFRVNILPDVCINVIPLHILVLDYLIAIYPMLLMAVAYTIVELYSFGFRPLRYIWKPFHYFFARFRRHWGIQNTVMDAFVTFFFLSTTKLLSVSCSLLIGVRVFTSDGTLYSLRLYYDPSIEYFGRVHLPYALLAIGILTIFIVFPTSLLLCYQFNTCRKFLTLLKVKKRALDKIMDIFQRYYKDGSNGTWDCRWFAGFFILIKLLAYVAYAASLTAMGFIFVVLICTAAAVIIVIVEPYKEEYKIYNVVSANLFLWEAMFWLLTVNKCEVLYYEAGLDDNYMSTAVLGFVPLVYIIVVVLHHLIRRFRGQKGGDGLTSSLPHRLLHSDQYRDSFGYIAAFSVQSQ